MREGIRPMKYTYSVNITVLTTVESDIPLDPDDIIEAAFLQTGIDPDDVNDTDVTGLNGTPDPYLGYMED